jgi:mRNA-degrading endonuclease RelE of RelBE toxin-antitoxin system
MTWACELTEAAEKDLKDLPRKVQERVARTLDQMAADPFLRRRKGAPGAFQGPCCILRHEIQLSKETT